MSTLRLNMRAPSHAQRRGSAHDPGVHRSKLVDNAKHHLQVLLHHCHFASMCSWVRCAGTPQNMPTRSRIHPKCGQPCTCSPVAPEPIDDTCRSMVHYTPSKNRKIWSNTMKPTQKRIYLQVMAHLCLSSKHISTSAECTYIFAYASHFFPQGYSLNPTASAFPDETWFSVPELPPPGLLPLIGGRF